jgi:ABC-type lipoprotein export system ATPase subunit
MRIQSVNLGPFEALDIEFPDKGVIKIDGKSGCGKSSFFTILTWIWTGEPRNGIIYLSAKKTDPVWGSFEYEGFKILRSKRPERLEVIDNDLIIDDKDAAAEYLSKKYGPNLLIEASSYASQETLHPLLDMSSTDRLSLIQSLIDTKEKPEKYRVIVDTKIRDLTAKIEKLDAGIKKYQKLVGNVDIKEIDDLEEDTVELEAKKIEKEKELEELKIKLTEFHQLHGSLNTLKMQLQKIKIDPDSGDLDKKISECKEKKQLKEKEKLAAIKYAAELNNRNRISALKKQQDEVKNKLASFGCEEQIEIDKYNLKQIQRQESDFKEHTGLCAKLGIEYKEEAIKTVIVQMASDLEYYKTSTLRKKIEILKLKCRDTAKYSVEDLKKWDSLNKLLKCPNCSAGLRYDNESLHLEISDLPTIPISANEIKTEMIKIQEHQKNTNLLAEMESNITDNSEPKWPKEKCDQIILLKKIPIPLILEPVISSEKLEKAIAKDKLKKQLTTIVEELAAIPLTEMPPQDSPEVITKEINGIEKQITELTDIKTQKEIMNKLNKEITKHEIKLKDFIGIEEAHDKCTKIINKWTDKIKKILEAKSIKEKLARIKEKESSKEEYATELAILGKIRKVMVTVEYDMLSEVITTLNLEVGKLLEMLFEEPFTIIIKNSKEIKSTAQKKNDINIEYHLNGNTFDSTKLLSCGQKNRVAVALTLVFSQLSEIPFLIIDEKTAFLNEDLREAMREAIRQTAADKIVLLVSHNDMSDDYDDIHDFENYM